MKIGEIIELTQTESLANIAKNHLVIGKEKARWALKKAGCYSKNGIKGWFFDGDDSVLEQPIYDFVEQKTTRKPSPKKSNTSIDKSSDVSMTLVKSELLASEKEIAITSKSELDAIDMLLLQNETTSNKRVYRGFYWDKDIIDFLDNVKHGNKSDLMNEIVRTVLKAKGLI